MMASVTRVILAIIAACIAAIAARTAVDAICGNAPSCHGYGLVAAGVAFVVVGLTTYLVMRRTSSAETEKDMRKVMAADTATGGGEFGDGDGGGD
jgi:hypothetical protein